MKFLLDSNVIVSLADRLVLGLGIGFATGLTGMGAAVIVVPTLIFVIGLPSVSAIGTGMLYSVLARAYASYVHIKLGTVLKNIALYVSFGSIPAVLISSIIITFLEKSFVESFDLGIKFVISGVMVITWIVMLLGTMRNRNECYNEDSYRQNDSCSIKCKVIGILSGAGVGLLVGTTSIGGGVFLIPLLTTLFRLSPCNIVGTSTIISVIMSGVGSIAYLFHGGIDIYTTIIMFIGSIPGIWLGSKLAVKIPHKILSFILFVVVTASIIFMFIETIANK